MIIKELFKKFGNRNYDRVVAHDLNPQKARILAMVALTKTPGQQGTATDVPGILTP